MNNPASRSGMNGINFQNASGQMELSERIVFDEYGNRYTLAEQIGQGGQGMVFRVNQGVGRNIAIKVQKVPGEDRVLKDEKAYIRTARMVRRIMAMPSIDCIALPVAMLQKPYCGYIMRLMERLKRIEAYMIPREKVGNAILHEFFEAEGGFAKRIRMLEALAKLLKQLHTHGIVYGDLSPGNIFISEDENEHQAWLIDVDNLRYESENDICIGTPMYMAPEVFNGHSNTMASDCYSFALIAFECLTYSKPFSGSIINEEPENDFGECAEDLIPAGKVPYIYEGDPSNKPLRGFQTNIDYLMTKEIQDLFMKTFCEEGRNNPGSRPRMSDWAKAFTNASASLVKCKQKHWHIGDSCLLCKMNGIANDTPPCYVLKTYIISEIYAPDQESADETDDSFDGDPKEIPVLCKDKFLRFSYSDEKKKEVRISVPYRFLSSAHPARREENTAFDIIFSDGQIKTGRIADAKLKVLYKSTSQDNTLSGSVVRVIYNNERKFEFRIDREKQ